MNDNNFITVQGWMILKLDLKGNELLAYSLIFGFSQDGTSKFQGSLKYICKWLNCTKPTARKALNSLVEKKLINRHVKEVNGVTFHDYEANLQVVKNLSGGGKESLLGGDKESLQGGGKESFPHINTIHNDELDNNRDSGKHKNSISKKRSNFKKPDQIEIFEYMISEGHQELFSKKESECFHDYFESNGWKVGGKTKMVDWKAAVRNWIRNTKKFNTKNTNENEKRVNRQTREQVERNSTGWNA